MIKDLCRIGSRLSLNHWMRWAGLGFLGLLILTLVTRCNSIENDIQQRTDKDLNAAGMSWAKSDLDGRGRDVMLTGVAPSETSKMNAITLVENIDGVRQVSHDISIKQYVSSTFSFKQTDAKVHLSGIFPNQASIDRTITKAREVYGDDNVVNELTVSDSASKPAWLAGAVGVMAAMKVAEDFSMDASDDVLTISGVVESEEAKTLLLTQAKADLRKDITESIKVVKKGPTPAELAVEASRLAEIDRLAMLAKEERIAEQAAALKLAEEERLAEKKRLAAEAELLRLAEEKRQAEEAELARLAEEKRLAAEAELARLTEEKRLADEAQKIAVLERIAAAEKARLAKLEAIRMAEQQALAAAQKQRNLLVSCQANLNHLLDSNTSLFYDGTSTIKGTSYPVLAMLAVQINGCSEVLHQNNQLIDIQATDNNIAIAKARQSTVISYLENINGAHRGLLRMGQPTSATSNGTSQLTFTLSK
ncbi:BON domain-containing protein [Leucothrix arctica]|uniref:BON domain-containing protein n=1 Tax=Leucothrix arctica TaxID=1481894 RepID=A0A317CG75_9GAMM|nr:BON domain-containing protein [Leucothrix arctica]PWQ97584.1 hypothetical protein DKT75_06605 [Leucothrix arctica]